jgi:hypothetical protein
MPEFLEILQAAGGVYSLIAEIVQAGQGGTPPTPEQLTAVRQLLATDKIQADSDK